VVGQAGDQIAFRQQIFQVRGFVVDIHWLACCDCCCQLLLLLLRDNSSSAAAAWCTGAVHTQARHLR
jgi:hypothetical protein